MAIMWNGSLIPWTDANGDPQSGLQAYFFDAGTTTPQVTYTDAALSIPHDHPVVANSSGKFAAVFLVEEGTYRLRIVEADDTTEDDVDGISVPTATPTDFPVSDTAAEFLYQTGDIKMAWRTAAPTGYVRLNGRTIGSATSGATERANADASALFIHLWTEDANLAVSSGRGGTAVGDFAANKTIALPDWRGRAPVGLDSMGNSASGRVTDAQLGADSDTLGSAGGASTHALITAELASHDHGGTTSSNGAHTHTTTLDSVGIAGTDDAAVAKWSARTSTNYGAVAATTSSNGAHTHTISAAGSGTAHNNLQPSILVPFFIKL